MRVYIATKFQNTDGFRLAKTLLEAAGHTITHDWTKESDAGMVEPNRTLYRQRCAEADLLGVASADAILMIPVAQPMAGAFVELGLALALGKLVLMVDAFHEGHQQNIFYYLSSIEHHATIEDAVRSLKEPAPVIPGHNGNGLACCHAEAGA